MGGEGGREKRVERERERKEGGSQEEGKRGREGGRKRGREEGREEGGKREGRGREGVRGGGKEREGMDAEQGEQGQRLVMFKDQLNIPTSVFLQSHSVLKVVLTGGLCCPCQQRPHHHCGRTQC